MIGVVVMVRSFRSTVEAWVNQTVMADLIIAPPAWLHGLALGVLVASLALGILRGGWAGIAVAGGFALVYLGLVFTPAPEDASDVSGRLWRSEPVLVAGVALLAAGIVASYIARPLDVVNRLWRAHRALLVGGLVVLSSLVVVLAYLLLA